MPNFELLVSHMQFINRNQAIIRLNNEYKFLRTFKRPRRQTDRQTEAINIVNIL